MIILYYYINLLTAGLVLIQYFIESYIASILMKKSSLIKKRSKKIKQEKKI